jgi:transcriptional regulator with XRE-family HTH domain
MPKERRGNLKSRSDIILAADAHIGHRIHVRRRLMDLSQSALAEKLGINAARLRKMEAGHAPVGAGQLYVIATELGTPVEFFFEDFDERTEGGANLALENMETPVTATRVDLLSKLEKLPADQRQAVESLLHELLQSQKGVASKSGTTRAAAETDEASEQSESAEVEFPGNDTPRSEDMKPQTHAEDHGREPATPSQGIVLSEEASTLSGGTGASHDTSGLDPAGRASADPGEPTSADFAQTQPTSIRRPAGTKKPRRRKPGAVWDPADIGDED